MKSLLKIEWLKLKHYGAFKIILLFFVMGVFLTNYIVYRVTSNVEENVKGAMVLGDLNVYSFYNSWQTTSYVTGWLLIIPAMLLIILITNEYSYKTSRQNIIDGWSRLEFIQVKLVLALILSLICTLLVIISVLIFGFSLGSEFSLNSVSHVGFFFLKSLSYNLVAVFISVLIKKTGFAIGLYFIYMGAENFLSQLLDFASIKLKATGNGDFGSMGDYLPMNAADGLLTFPSNNLKSMASGIMPTNYFWIVVLCTGIYIILFTWLSIRKFVKDDL